MTTEMKRPARESAIHVVASCHWSPRYGGKKGGRERAMFVLSAVERRKKRRNRDTRSRGLLDVGKMSLRLQDNSIGTR